MQTAQVIPYQFESKQVRAYSDEAGEPWFCATDVCSALGYANTSKAISDNCREKGVTSSYTLTSKGRQALTFINEGNLYRLIIKSRKEEAQRFEAWVCDEVLPAIRKHGRYDDCEGKMNALIGQTIGNDGFCMLAAVVKGKVTNLPVPIQRRASDKIWSQTRAAFGVRSATDIPAEQLDSARNFIAAYVIHDGEWLPKNGQRPGTFVLDECQARNLYNLLHYTDWVNYRWNQGISEALKLLNPHFHSHTLTFFREANLTAQGLERALPELMGYFRGHEGSGLRPREQIEKGLKVVKPAD